MVGTTGGVVGTGGKAATGGAVGTGGKAGTGGITSVAGNGGEGGDGGSGGSATNSCPRAQPTGSCAAYPLGDICDYPNNNVCVCAPNARGGGRTWECGADGNGGAGGAGGAGGLTCPARRPTNLSNCLTNNAPDDVCAYAAVDCTCTGTARQARWVCR
jgi:hypothetical protein